MVLDRLIARAHAGTSGVLVVRGEAGVGKTALLAYLGSQSAGCRVVRLVGVESEMELGYSGLQQLCAPFLDRLERLPGPQQDALATAFGLRAGDSPDRFLVGLAALTLLGAVAEEQPLVCLMDDVQWLDRRSVQVLGFVARRLAMQGVVLVFALRGHGEDRDLAGLPELRVEPLGDTDARALLASALPGRIEEAVLDRIVAEAHGNPLALLEFLRAWTPTAFAGGFGLPNSVGVSTRFEERFRRRLAALPAQTRRLLLIAAAEPTGDPILVWAAAERLGINSDAAGDAATAGLLDAGDTLRFSHPLVRFVVYQEAEFDERRLVHAALAEATDVERDPDRRVWHRAQAALDPDEDAALMLELSAEQAQRRGGLGAAAAFLAKASDLTPVPARRGARALAAAEAMYFAGAPVEAQRLLSTAEAGPLSPLQRARSDLLRGQIAFTVRRRTDAPRLLLTAAKHLESLDPVLARETYLDALVAAQFAGVPTDGCLREVAEAARRAPASPAPGAPDLLLDALAVLVTDGRVPATPLLKQAVAAFRRDDDAASNGFRWLWPATAAALAVWDRESWDALTRRQVRRAREVGALIALPLALSVSIHAAAFGGDLAAAASLLRELETVQDATGSRLAPQGALLLAVWGGHAEQVSALSETILEDVVARGEGFGVTATHWATSLFYNSVGRYEDALQAAQLAWDRPIGLTAASEWAGPELIEAAARSGKGHVARGALERLSVMARASGTDWGLGLEARSRALLAADGDAEPLYREGVERLDRSGLPGELGRAHLVYGEWLRRQNRRVDARKQLRAAHDIFVSMGAAAFAGRARGELMATGETVRKRAIEVLEELTPQELQIARLASDGRTNPEIGVQLFLSPRTIEWHLRKVFAKLGVASRRELPAALSHV